MRQRVASEIAVPTPDEAGNSAVKAGANEPRPGSPGILESRRERKKRASRARIYEAAVDRFMAVGYEAATIDEIAEAADISRATFFNYYPSKEAILRELANEAVEYAKRIFDREFRKSAPVEKKIKSCLQRFARVVERNPKYYDSVFLDVMRSQAGFAGPSSHGPDNLIGVLEGHLRAEQTRGELDAELNPAQLAEMLTGIYMYTILNGILRGLPDSLVERMNKAVEIFLRGCLPRPTNRPPQERDAFRRG